MKRLKSKITLLNTYSSLFLQLAATINGFIIPRLILSAFGSDVNGLVSSLTKFLSYIALVDGGISGVIIATLYKPLATKDNARTNAILATAKNFYSKIGIIYIIYALALAVAYPMLFSTNFSHGYVFLLTIIISIRTIIQYLFSLTLKSLLTADKKIYVVSFVQGIINLLEIVLTIIAIKIYPDIHILKAITGLIYLIQPLIFNAYVKKHYNIDQSSKIDNSLIKSRWNGFGVNLAGFIHGGTDTTVLTIFTNLATVSVYSVYALVTSGIRNIVMALVSSLNPVLGHAYAKKDFKNLHQKLDLYEYIIFMLVFVIFGTAALLITPFVEIYTNGINDANYSQNLFGILIVISEALYLLKWPHVNLAYSANKYKDVSKPAFIEAGLNIVISVVLVPFLGLIGVAIGTIVAMLYRLVFHVYYTSKIIPNRPQIIFYRKLLIFLLASALGIGLCLLVPAAKATIMSWALHAIIYSAILGAVLMLVSLLFFRPELRYLKNYLKKR